MGWRGTLVLAFAVAAAAAIAYVDLRSQENALSLDSILAAARPTPPGQNQPSLVEFDADDVDAVRLVRGSRDLRFERSGESWSGVSRAQTVPDFLAALRDLVAILKVDTQGSELADYGLDPPATTIVLHRRSAPPLVFRVGSHNPPSTGVYVEVGDTGDVVLTGALLLWEIDKIVRDAARAGEPG